MSYPGGQQGWQQPPVQPAVPPYPPQPQYQPQHPVPVPGGPPAYAPPGAPYGGYGGYGAYGGIGNRLPMSSAGKRFGAYLLEALLLMATLVIGWLVWSLCIWGRGQTPAKQLLHMRCVDQHSGQVAGWGTMALREIVGKAILANVTCGISTLVGAFMVLGESRQGVWDKIANTIVVDDPQDTLAA